MIQPLEDRTDALIARHRGCGDTPPRQEIEDLYTDGCAELLEIEVRHLRVKRRLQAAVLDASPDPLAAQSIALLSSEREQLARRRDELQIQLRHLRTAVEWHRTSQYRQSA